MQRRGYEHINACEPVRSTAILAQAFLRFNYSIGFMSSMQGVNTARFDFTSIRLVVLCAEMGSLSAATKQAHYTLSAGSQRLSALEHALGRRLFERGQRGLRITPAGQLVVQHGKAMLHELELMAAQVTSGEDASPSLTCESPTAQTS